ncbi:Kef-type K+ transport system membrane component KefB [Algoriphagus aquaeductus]|jgi:Kef-type K+ transport system membrane component KefB|uniref:Kef-type K+ transport system membrane component KefB n=1 Tax=Algoriphagus aquaeductus TaxID=475299 RepID=A0A326RJM2_9BACT|nr:MULTISPECIES: cation:proton antiporter [Algoriphagus]PZV77631.1 Kef-type K+ transport system membrane component KefB [Algoriphagus aquaeductus]
MESLAHKDVINLLLQLASMLLMARVFAEIAQKFKQPAVVGEIIAGIILGPTILGIIGPDFFEFLFRSNPSANLALDGIVQMAVILLLFIAGLEVELHLVWSQGKSAVSISLLGLVIPFILGFIFPYFFPTFFGLAEGSQMLFSLFMGTAMSITALPVVVRILMDMNLFKTKMGMVIVAGAMVNDIIGWLIFSVILSFMGQSSNLSLINTIGITLLFTVFMLTLGKGLLNKVLPWTNKKLAWPGGVLSLSMAFCFMLAAFTEWLGIHAIFGAFLFGVALGDSDHLSEKAKEIIHQFINNIFAPLFFVSIGLKINFFTNFDIGLVLAVIVISFAGKIIGSGYGALRSGYAKMDALAVGFGMNARGAMEIILGLIALENGLINEKLFVALVVMALVTSMTSGPLMKWALKKKAAS